MTVEGKELAIACARAADENKADNIQVFDVTGLSPLTDFLVICSGNSMPHLKAILRDTEGLVMREHGVKPYSFEGKAETQWVVLDYFDVMVHIMIEEAREAYALEDLWADAKSVEWQQ